MAGTNAIYPVRGGSGGGGGSATAANQVIQIGLETSIDTKLLQEAYDFGVSSAAIRVASLLGNATGAAAFGTGVRSAQVLRVTVATDDLVPVTGTVAVSGTVTVSGSVTANAGTNLNTSALALESGGNLATIAGVVTSNRAAVNPISGQAGVQGNTGAVSATTQRVTLATDVALPAGTNTIGNVALVPATSGGLTMFSALSVGTSGDATNVKASAGQLYGWYISNTNAAPAYVKFYNSASAPTAGSGTPVLRIAVPGSSSGTATNINYSAGIAFSAGIGFTIVTTAPDAGSTGVAANEVIINLLYK